ncbi:hypothetical protein Leryth_022032 [Lithospermum erythrorhizon]|nr:hypothetical protein Leryth_022032 [Lithospermum erythrorhizon]
MNSIFSLDTMILLIFISIPLVKPFTVIMPDSSSAASPLVDSPNKDGTRTNVREQEAVYDIMRATGNEWATTIRDVCKGRWHGIECMPDNDNIFHVVSLSFGELSADTAFPNCDLTPTPYISPSITKLTHLRTLFFYRCFTNNPQPIPSFLGQLGSTLQSLVLRENGHIGSIPLEIGNLTHLKTLDLHKNNLNGSIPLSLGRLTGLKTLDLSENKLTGSIPSLKSPMLNIVDLNRNHLSGSIPTTLTSCISLIKLDSSHNRLSGSIPESIGELKSLILMDLSYNSLSGPLPTSFKNLNFLEVLILSGNPMVSSTIPNDIFDNGLKDLMILVMSNMNLEGPIPEAIGRMHKLRVLHLDGNQLNGSLPSNFGSLENLSELRLDSNKLTGPVPFKKEMVWKMRRKLRLHDNSGLCYDARTGLGDDLTTLSDNGIGHCETTFPTSKGTIEHVTNVGVDHIGFHAKSSHGGSNKSIQDRFLYLTMLVLLIHYVM